jgi:hypothetical protein
MLFFQMRVSLVYRISQSESIYGRVRLLTPCSVDERKSRTYVLRDNFASVWRGKEFPRFDVSLKLPIVLEPATDQ